MPVLLRLTCSAGAAGLGRSRALRGSHQLLLGQVAAGVEGREHHQRRHSGELAGTFHGSREAVTCLQDSIRGVALYAVNPVELRE
jgi:hypothetical protein